MESMKENDVVTTPCETAVTLDDTAAVEETVTLDETVEAAMADDENQEETQIHYAREDGVIEVEEDTKFKLGFFAAAMVVLAVLIAGVFVINTTPMKRLVGAWEIESQGMTFMFATDGDYFINGFYVGTYSTSSSQLTMYMEDGDPQVYEYEIDENMLILTEVPSKEDKAAEDYTEPKPIVLLEVK